MLDRKTWLGCLAFFVLLAGCLSHEIDGDWDESSPELGAADGQLQYALMPEPQDVALCTALAEREAGCSDTAAAVDVGGCAQQYACSRQLWRPDIAEDVYACIETRPCADRDPGWSCLREIASRREPSATQRRFERQLADNEASCDGLVEIAPGQADEVYEALTHCMLDNDACDAKAACAMLTLDRIVEGACGVGEEI